MTTQGFFNPTLTAHELGHQWWGDYVTCASWCDIWVNEGFASYSEQLMLENLYPGQEIQNMQSVHNNVMSQPGGSVWVLDSLNESRIFSGRLTYDKGAAIIHTMRYMVNNDNLFLSILQNFLSNKAFGTAFGVDVRDAFTAASGIDFTAFFDEWYFGEGFPTYSVQWKQVGNDALVQISHTSSMPNVTPTFTNPIDLKFVRPGNADTTIRFNITGNSNLFQINGIGTINNSITIDPNNWVLNQNGSVTMNQVLNLEAINEPIGMSLFPNPVQDQLTLLNVPQNSSYRLYDMFGRMKLSGKAINGEALSVSALSPGTYLLVLDSPEVNYRKTFVKN